MRSPCKIIWAIALALTCTVLFSCDDASIRNESAPKNNSEFAHAKEDLLRMRSWVTRVRDRLGSDSVAPITQELLNRIDLIMQDPLNSAVSHLRREILFQLGRFQGGDGSYAVAVTHSLEKIFIDEPYRGDFPDAMEIALAKNESEGAQLVILSSGGNVQNIKVSLAGRLVSSTHKTAYIPESQVRINLVGYVDTTTGKRPYESSKLGWWPDPLLPERPFSVSADEVQPLLVTVTSTDETVPGEYVGKIVVSAVGRKKIFLPLKVTVFEFSLPKRGNFATFALGCSPDIVTKFYGDDSKGKIMEQFVTEAFRNRMPPTGLLNGWGWKAAKVAKKDDGSYDFSKIDRWLDLYNAKGVTRFPMAIVPRFRKFGGGEYTEDFKAEFASFVRAYAAHLKKKGLFEHAVLYNIDEASNDPKRQEWAVCKEIYQIVKRAVPDLPVVQCLNEYKGVKALIGFADIWDLYYRQFEKIGGTERLKAGEQIILTVCIWPSERPNLFIEYPLLDARIMPWISFRTGAKGFEYWEMFASWQENIGNKDWWRHGTRTSWILEKPHGDGLLMYPGSGGMPLSSLRLESLRDGIEDYEYLHLLAEKTRYSQEARSLLAEATSTLITGVTSYDTDPKKLLDLRKRIAHCLK